MAGICYTPDLNPRCPAFKTGTRSAFAKTATKES